MDTFMKVVKIGEKYHLLANEKKTECGRKVTGQIQSGPVPFGSLCNKCKETRALREGDY